MSSPLHPVLKDMLSLGCNNQSTVSLAFQVYMELSEVRRCWDVTYSYSPVLGLIYFSTLNHKSQKVPEIIVPLSAFREVSPAWINQVINTLSPDGNRKVITLAFKDSDSTVLFYKVYDGLEEPSSVEESQAVKLTEERKRLLEADLRKSQTQLYDIARSESLE